MNVKTKEYFNKSSKVVNLINGEDFDRYLTVGQLKQIISDQKLKDDAIVYVERIEDVYFDGVDLSGMAGDDSTEDGIFPEGS